MYLTYGIRHSVAGRMTSLQQVPDEQRILLPDDDDHVTSRDVTSAAQRRPVGTGLQGDANARPSTALRL